MIEELEHVFEKSKEKDCEENKSRLFNIIQNYSDSLEDQQDELNKVKSSVGIHQHYVSIKKKLIYLRIDKCASSSIVEYFSTRSDFIPIHEDSISTRFPYEQDIEKIKNYNIFTVIRDPKSRWISGLNQLISCVYKGPISKLEIYIEQELSKNKFFFDTHTLPQINCLPSKIDSSFISNLILLRLDKNLNQKISSLLGEDVQIKHKNRTSTDPNKKNNLNFCKKMFETYCEKNPKYYRAYEFDYRLFNLSK
jgi:hypothetical protein